MAGIKAGIKHAEVVIIANTVQHWGTGLVLITGLLIQKKGLAKCCGSNKKNPMSVFFLMNLGIIRKS